MIVSDKKKKQLIQELVTKNFTEAGKAIGLQERYNTDSGIRGAAYALYKKVVQDSEKLGISKDLITAVSSAIEDRKTSSNREIKEVMNTDLLDPEDMTGLVVGGRNKVAMLIHRKLDQIGSSRRALEAQNLSALATVFGIFFDKSQILQGQATENIAVFAKISDKMTPEESLSALLNMREQNEIEKQDKPIK